MFLYYTIVSAEDHIQQKPQLSLGGFKAINKVDSGKLNNLFSDISQLTVANYNQNLYIALILKNELSSTANNVKIYFSYPENCYSKLRVAAVNLFEDSEGFLQMEHVETPNSKPLFAEFFEADGLDNAVNIGNILPGDMIGIWIERELLVEFINEDQSLVYEEDPNMPTRYRERELQKEDNININISWD